MRKAQRQVIVEISSTRHEITVFKKGVLLGRRSSRPNARDADPDWAAGLLAFEAELSLWVTELDIEGCQTTVLYTGPDTIASVYDCPAAGGEQRAKHAAKVAMARTTLFPIEQNAHAEISLYKDTTAPEGDHTQVHTLALADTEGTIMALTKTLERAGLRPTFFVPAPGASLAAAIEQLDEITVDTTPRVVLWIGEHSSVITAGESGRVALARLVPVGTETLVEALARPVVSDQRAEPLMDRSTAYDLLFTSGIPVSDGWHHDSPSLDAQEVLPLVQPPVQRLVVELKQSIRFGLRRDVRQLVKLLVSGPGSQIPGLQETIAKEVSLEVVEQISARSATVQSVQGDTSAALALGSRMPAIMSRTRTSERVVSNTRRAIWAGAVMALAAIGTDVIASRSRIVAAQETMQQADAETTYLNSDISQTMQTALAARQGLRHAQVRERTLISGSPQYAAVLRALSAMTPETVSLTEVVFTEEGERATGTIRGWAVADDEVSETVRFREFVSAIRACPLVAETTLGETLRTREEGRQALSFIITLELVDLPAGLEMTWIDATGEPPK